jgi:hypothetical protein
MRARYRRWSSMALYLMLAGATLSQGGCLWLALGAAGAAGAAGYAYYQGEKSRQYRTATSTAVPATRAALVDLGFPIRGEEVREGKTVFTTRARDGTPVQVTLAEVVSPIPADAPMTSVAVRVGTFGDEKVSQRILDQVHHRIGTPALASAPPPASVGRIRPVAHTAPPETSPPPLAAPGK